MSDRTLSTRERTLLRLRIPGPGEPVFQARARLVAAMRRLGVDTETAGGILLAFSEAVTNALLHGRAPTTGHVHARVMLRDGQLLIEVRDHGCGFRPDHIALPAPDRFRENGRGVFLMRAMMDGVEWIPSPRGTTVRMVKALGAERPPIPIV